MQYFLFALQLIAGAAEDGPDSDYLLQSHSSLWQQQGPLLQQELLLQGQWHWQDKEQSWLVETKLRLDSADRGSLLQNPFPAAGSQPKLELQQLWYGRHGTLLEMKLGWQQFDWSLADSISPADLLNPRDFSDITRVTKRALPALSLQWQWQRPLQLVVHSYTPAAVLPADSFALPQTPGVLLNAAEPKQNNLSYGLRWSGNDAGIDWFVLGYKGHNYAPSADLVPTEAQPRIQVFHDKLQQLSFGLTSPVAENSLFRAELARVWQFQGDDYWQWVVSLEQEWFGLLTGQELWSVLLQWADEKVAKQGTELPGWTDFRRMFQHNLMLRLSYDPDGGAELQTVLELSSDLAAESRYLKLYQHQRLNDQWQLQVGTQQFFGTAAGVWGLYQDKDRLYLQLDYHF